MKTSYNERYKKVTENNSKFIIEYTFIYPSSALQHIGTRIVKYRCLNLSHKDMIFLHKNEFVVGEIERIKSGDLLSYENYHNFNKLRDLLHLESYLQRSTNTLSI